MVQILKILCRFVLESPKSVGNAPKRLKAGVVHVLLNLRALIRRGKLSKKNAYLRFLHEKFAKINLKVKIRTQEQYILGATPHFMRKSNFIGNFFLETTFRL